MWWNARRLSSHLWTLWSATTGGEWAAFRSAHQAGGNDLRSALSGLCPLYHQHLPRLDGGGADEAVPTKRRRATSTDAERFWATERFWAVVFGRSQRVVRYANNKINRNLPFYGDIQEEPNVKIRCRALLSTLVVLSLPSACFAWGDGGHEMVAYIAYQRLKRIRSASTKEANVATRYGFQHGTRMPDRGIDSSYRVS